MSGALAAKDMEIATLKEEIAELIEEKDQEIDKLKKENKELKEMLARAQLACLVLAKNQSK